MHDTAPDTERSAPPQTPLARVRQLQRMAQYHADELENEDCMRYRDLILFLLSTVLKCDKMASLLGDED